MYVPPVRHTIKSRASRHSRKKKKELASMVSTLKMCGTGAAIYNDKTNNKSKIPLKFIIFLLKTLK